MHSTHSPNHTTWIATRRLTDPQGGPDLEVRIGAPVPASSDDWECPFLLAETGQPEVPQAGHGVDAFQALVQAQEGIRVALAKRGRELSWLGGEPGFTGFTRSIPISFGLGLVRHLEAMVEAETEQYARAAAAGQHRRPYENP